MSHPHFCQMSEISFKKAKRSPHKSFFRLFPNVAPPLLPDVGDFILKSEKKPPKNHGFRLFPKCRTPTFARCRRFHSKKRKEAQKVILSVSGSSRSCPVQRLRPAGSRRRARRGRRVGSPPVGSPPVGSPLGHTCWRGDQWRRISLRGLALRGWGAFRAAP